MTDTKCPHCEAVFSCIDSTGRYYTCGTSIHDTATHQSDVCALRYLRAKVAAQQELLKEVAQVIDEVVGILGCGDDYDSLYIQRLSALHRTISAAL